MGTYNYAAGIPRADAHTRFDVQPFLLYGNTPDATQRGFKVIQTAAQQALIQYQTHALDVFAYRKAMFGVQDGRVQ